MSDKYQLSRKYATMLREAAEADAGRISRRLMESVSKDRRSRLLAILVELGSLIDGFVYDDNSPASEQDKGEVIDLIALELDYPDTRRLGRLLREGSVSALMTMSQSIEDLFAALRK